MQRPSPAILVFVTLLSFACATSYQPGGSSGGFSETQIAADSYEVRIEANTHSSRDRASQFLLRRCAELTLEKGERYFRLSGQESQTKTTGDRRWTYSSPSNQATIHILHANEDGALDAAVIIPATEAIADGRLSPSARLALAKIQGRQ